MCVTQSDTFRYARLGYWSRTTASLVMEMEVGDNGMAGPSQLGYYNTTNSFSYMYHARLTCTCIHIWRVRIVCAHTGARQRCTCVFLVVNLSYYWHSECTRLLFLTLLGCRAMPAGIESSMEEAGVPWDEVSLISCSRRGSFLGKHIPWSAQVGYWIVVVGNYRSVKIAVSPVSKFLPSFCLLYIKRGIAVSNLILLHKIIALTKWPSTCFIYDSTTMLKQTSMNHHRAWRLMMVFEFLKINRKVEDFHT